MEPIKKEYDASEPAHREVTGLNQHGRFPAPMASYGEGSGTRFVKIPNHYYPSQAPISAPFPQKHEPQDAYYNPAAIAQYTLEPSSLNYSNTSDVQPTSSSLMAATPGRESKPRPSKGRGEGRKTTKSELIEGRETTKSDLLERIISINKGLSQVAMELGCYETLLQGVEAFATRSIEKRLREKAKNDGQVKRPLNAFMLYRRTFQKMVSVFCKGEKENHQEISKATGYCWRNLEPQKIHDIFERLGVKGKGKARGKAGGSTKGGRVTRNNTKAPKLQYLPEEVLLQAVDEKEQQQQQQQQLQQQQQPLPANAFASHPYWAFPAIQASPVVYAEEYYHVYPDPTPYQTRNMAASNDNPPTGRMSPPVVHGLFVETAEPHTTFADPCVDPSLLYQQPNITYEMPSIVAFQRQRTPVPTERSHMRTTLPSLNTTSPHDAYLKGVDADWEVKEFHEDDEFAQWMGQSDQQVEV
ncbi:hypothetical protein TrVFT333_005802 [Trichoderma virens FT-333]|nr:hypothetical protein TrVFT333_005802 [Trichoderma virens FT-333]